MLATTTAAQPIIRPIRGIRIELVNNECQTVAVRDFPEGEREQALAFPNFWVKSGFGWFLEGTCTL